MKIKVKIKHGVRLRSQWHSIEWQNDESRAVPKPNDDNAPDINVILF